MGPHLMEPVFDDLVHAPLRLRLCVALDAVAEMEFAALEEVLGVSTSVLSKHLRLLVEAGYVALDKRRQPFGRPRTWVALTASGRRAFAAHAAALREMLDG